MMEPGIQPRFCHPSPDLLGHRAIVLQRLFLYTSLGQSKHCAESLGAKQTQCVNWHDGNGEDHRTRARRLGLEPWSCGSRFHALSTDQHWSQLIQTGCYFCLCFLRWGFAMWSRLALNSRSSPGWPQTQGDSLASASQVLGSQVYATMLAQAVFRLLGRI